MVWWRAIVPGETWDEAIKENLHKADIILLLLSPDSLASDYFYNKEVADALVRHQAGVCKVVPVIVRHCLWETTELAHLQALPQDAKPIADWKTPDAAYKSIALGVAKLVEDIKTDREQAQKAAEQHKTEQERLQREREEAESLRHDNKTRREREQREQVQKAEQERLQREREKVQNQKKFWQQLQATDDLFEQKQYAQAQKAYQSLLQWHDKSEMGDTDAQAHLTKRLLQCKTETQLADLKAQAYTLHQQGNYKAALNITQQALQHRTDPDMGNLQNELKSLIQQAEQQRNVLLQKVGMGAAGLLLLLLLGWGIKKVVTRPENTPATSSNTGESTDPFAAQMVLIQGNTFMMGSPESEADRYDDEYQHQVSLSSFKMSKYEVTQAQWEAIMGSNPSHFSGCAQCPVEKVSWDDIQVFLSKLKQLTGKSYTLPTEAQWEYAARGGTSAPFYTGNCLSTDQANYNGNYPYQTCAKGKYHEKTTSVGSFAPNKYGLYDMHGNVWEWCQDWYGGDYYNNSSAKNPKGSNTGTNRVLRGGGWNMYAQYCRSAHRGNRNPDIRYNSYGLRLVLVQ